MLGIEKRPKLSSCVPTLKRSGRGFIQSHSLYVYLKVKLDK